MSRLEIRTLGLLSLLLNDDPVDTSRNKAIALLIYLAMTGERHRRDALAAMFWPDYEQARAYAYLRRTLWEIRNVLGEEWLDADRDTVAVVRDAGIWIDALAFRKDLAATARHDHAPAAVCPACIEPLSRVAALYRGDFLHGFSLRDSPAFDDWQFFVGEGLRQDACDALRRLAAIHGREHRLDEAIASSRRWLALDPLNEDAHRQAMLLLALNGQRGAALRQYQECVRILASEMGITPERKTTDLSHQIEQGHIPAVRPAGELPPAAVDDADLPRTSEPPAAAHPIHHNLPRLLTPFVGREREIGELDAMLADPDVRLLTILAVGGMGKTRLAIETAARHMDRFEHGVAFTYLAPLQSPSGLVPALMESLELAPSETIAPKTQLLEYLSDRQLLLLLDNFEHLLNESRQATDLVAEILEAAPAIKLVVTSRLPINLQGEYRYHLAGMDFPENERSDKVQDVASIKLFVQGARRAAPGYRLGAEDLPHVVAICRAAAGMPLGILLAAGWVGLLSPREIANQMRSQRDFLETDVQDIPERHRSMRLVLQHAWDLMGDQERQAFQRLSVFRGSFDRQAAQEVSGASLRMLMGLVNKSMLTRLASDQLVVHELLRQFAAQRLSDDVDAYETARDRHSDFYCRRLRVWTATVKLSGRQQLLAEIQRDIENLRVAWTWAALDRQVARLADAAEGLGLLLSWQANNESGEAAFRLAAESLALPNDDEERALLSYLLAWQALFANMILRSPEHVSALIEQSAAWLDGIDDQSPAAITARAFLLFVRGQMAQFVLETKAADICLDESLALFEKAGDRWWSATLLEEIGRNAWAMNDMDRTAAYFRRSLAARQALGDHLGTAGLMINLGALAGFDGGRVDEAEALYREASQRFASFSDRANRIASLNALQAAERLHGRYPEAMEIIRRQMALAVEAGNKEAIANCRLVLGEVHQLMGRYDLAEGEHRQNIANFQDAGWLAPETWARYALSATLLGQRNYAEAKEVLLPNVRALEQSHGYSMLGRSLAIISRAELGLNQPDAAWEHALQAVTLLTDRHYFWLLEGMAALAAVLAGRGEAGRAVQIWALLNRHPAVANAHWYQDVFGSLVDKAANGLPAAVRLTAQSRGTSMDLWLAAREIMAEYSQPGQPAPK